MQCSLVNLLLEANQFDAQSPSMVAGSGYLFGKNVAILLQKFGDSMKQSASYIINGK